MDINKRFLIFGFILIVVLISLACAPGNERWDQELSPGNNAGFWAGLWHGLIIIITFIVSLFTNDVGVYEISNTGWSYNLGFIIGLLFSLGGGIRIGTSHHSRKRNWEKIGKKIEVSVRKGIKAWLEEVDKKEKEKEWDKIAERIEEEIKKALRE